jgi:uncharacterized membrane protein YhaH (DUF805 family)
LADLFLSYAREDRERAEHVARLLEAQGFDIFWDSEIPPGQSRADFVESKLSLCRAVIVLWSENSAKSPGVREEARMGRDAGKLIPARIDAAASPFGFGEVQAADLSAWDGRAEHGEWRRLVSAVENAVGRAAKPAPPQPSPRPPPSFIRNDAPTTRAWDYVKKCLLHYVNGHGRARRREFWWFALFCFAVLVAAASVDIAAFGVGFNGDPNLALFTALAFVALIAPLASVAVRRFHDVGLSGWLTLFGLIPYLGLVFIAVVGLIPGAPEPNRHGPNPKST